MTDLAPAENDTTILRFDRQRRLAVVDLERVARPFVILLTPEARDAVDRCERFVYKVAASGRPVYGLTTGFGPLVAYKDQTSGSWVKIVVEVGQVVLIL